ncbi:hypothetical protein SRABI128_04703 [Microbacterium sp. Bi128]|nr:hypothetical protein SRABI128_04703 [Microbacterium sp. Bi128]
MRDTHEVQVVAVGLDAAGGICKPGERTGGHVHGAAAAQQAVGMIHAEGVPEFMCQDRSGEPAVLRHQDAAANVAVAVGHSRGAVGEVGAGDEHDQRRVGTLRPAQLLGDDVHDLRRRLLGGRGGLVQLARGGQRNVHPARGGVGPVAVSGAERGLRSGHGDGRVRFGCSLVGQLHRHQCGFQRAGQRRADVGVLGLCPACRRFRAHKVIHLPLRAWIRHRRHGTSLHGSRRRQRSGGHLSGGRHLDSGHGGLRQGCCQHHGGNHGCRYV